MPPGTTRGTPHTAKLRQHRQAAGLTQGELSQRAGVSRQLVAAVESGRHTPSVDGALRLARALGTTVEELFTSVSRRVIPAVDGQLREGAEVRVAQVGDQLVAAEVADHGVAGAGWARADGAWKRGQLQLHPGASAQSLALAGCEPAFGIAEQLLAGLGPRSLIAIPASTGRALTALRRQRVHAAVVHGPEGGLPAAPRPVRRIHVARWLVGLAASGSAVGDLEAVLSAGHPVIQREPSAAVQQAFQRFCGSVALEAPVAPVIAAGHIEAARVAAGRGCPALTTEPAAHAFKLRFLPFEEHTVELWLDESWLGHPGADALAELLSTRAFSDRVARRGGYDLSGCGEIVRS